MSIPSIEEFWSLPVNSELCDFYKSMICSLNVSDETKKKLSVPLLMQASPGYVNNPGKGVFFVGQETWGWGGDSATVGTSYESFLRDPNREYRMMEAQSDFIVDRYECSRCKNSPLWEAFRDVARIKTVADVAYRPFLWSDIVACDYEGHSFLNCMQQKEENAFIEFSKRKFIGELSILKPKVCLLFTGPNYDYILERYFDLPKNWEKNDIRSLKECSNPHEPLLIYVKMFEWKECLFIRTYHPKSLRMQRKWKIVNIIAETVDNLMK